MIDRTFNISLMTPIYVYLSKESSLESSISENKWLSVVDHISTPAWGIKEN